jgi:hypothetical protein
LVAHFDGTGFRAAEKPAWARLASSGKYMLVTVHEKRCDCEPMFL